MKTCLAILVLSGDREIIQRAATIASCGRLEESAAIAGLKLIIAAATLLTRGEERSNNTAVIVSRAVATGTDRSVSIAASFVARGHQQCRK